MDPGIDDVLMENGFDPGFDEGFVEDSGGLLQPGVFDVFAVIPLVVMLAFVAVVVLMVVGAVRKARRYRAAGIDPMTADVERDIRIMQALNRPADAGPRPGTGAPSLEQRLDDLDRLYQSGKITSAEREAARARILGSI